MPVMSPRPRIFICGIASKAPSSVHNAAAASPEPLSTAGPYWATSCVISAWSSRTRTLAASFSTMARSSSISLIGAGLPSDCFPLFRAWLARSRHHDDASGPVGVAGRVKRGGHLVEPDGVAEHRPDVEVARADRLERLVPVGRQRAAAKLDVETLPLGGQRVQVVA